MSQASEGGAAPNCMSQASVGTGAVCCMSQASADATTTPKSTLPPISFKTLPTATSPSAPVYPPTSNTNNNPQAHGVAGQPRVLAPSGDQRTHTCPSQLKHPTKTNPRARNSARGLRSPGAIDKRKLDRTARRRNARRTHRAEKGQASSEAQEPDPTIKQKHLTTSAL